MSQLLKRIPVLLMGVGGVGRDLLRQVIQRRSFTARRYAVKLDFYSLFDRHSRLGNPRQPLNDDLLLQALHCKKNQGALHECGGEEVTSLKDAVAEFSDLGAILVDCTATEETVTALFENLRNNGKIVLANKKPLTTDLEVYRELTADLSRSRWETTVGSALPVITTLNRLQFSGDEILAITGSLSGTLGFLMSGLEDQIPFGRLIREAHQAGATEPDPREDLSGMDVARKALILARGMGMDLDLEQIETQGLLPPHFQNGTVDGFLERVQELDDEYRIRSAEVRQKKMVLRYIARVDREACRVGLADVPAESPLGRLKGNDNLVEIHSRLFKPNPLLIQGRGAGVEATAAGVLSDILELALV